VSSYAVYELSNSFHQKEKYFIDYNMLSTLDFVGEKNLNDNFEYKELTLIDECKAFFYRQKAQCGVFTSLDSDSETDLITYLNRVKPETVKENIRVLLLPAKEVHLALSMLDKMNINYHTLFPDIEGVVKYTNTIPGIGSNVFRYNLFKEISKPFGGKSVDNISNKNSE
jgi:hypothetical protein